MLQNYHTTAAGTHSDMFPKPDPPNQGYTKKGGKRKEKEKYTLQVFFFFLSNL